TLTRTADGASATVSGSVAVGENDQLSGSGTSLSATAGQPFSGEVTSLSDSDTLTPAGDLSATIAWGDGTTSAGTVSGSNGAFTVSGSSDEARGGEDGVRGRRTDDGEGKGGTG